jgi:hypothetical protein
LLLNISSPLLFAITRAGHAGARNEVDERDSQISSSSAHLRSFLACEDFDRDKAENESRADQRLFAKRVAGNAEIIMRDVRERVRDNRRARHREKECNSEMEEFLHLSPRRRRHARGWLWRRGSIHFSRNAPRAGGHLRVMPDPETSGKSCQQRGMWRSPDFPASQFPEGQTKMQASGATARHVALPTTY